MCLKLLHGRHVEIYPRVGFPLVVHVLLKIPPWGGIFEKIRVLRGIFWHKSPTNCTATRGIFESRVVIFDNFGIKHVIFPALVLFSHIRCMNLSKTHTKVLSLHFLCSCTGCIFIYGVLCLLILTQKTWTNIYKKCTVLKRRDAAFSTSFYFTIVLKPTCFISFDIWNYWIRKFNHDLIYDSF